MLIIILRVYKPKEEVPIVQRTSNLTSFRRCKPFAELSSESSRTPTSLIRGKFRDLDGLGNEATEPSKSGERTN